MESERAKAQAIFSEMATLCDISHAEVLLMLRLTRAVPKTTRLELQLIHQTTTLCYSYSCSIPCNINDIVEMP